MLTRCKNVTTQENKTQQEKTIPISLVYNVNCVVPPVGYISQKWGVRRTPQKWGVRRTPNTLRWRRPWVHSYLLHQELIRHRYSCCFCWGDPLQKSLAPSFKIRSQWNNNGSIVFQVNIFWYDVTLSRWRPWHHLTQKTAAIWWVHTQRLPGAPASALCCICSSVRRMSASNSVYSSWSIEHSDLL